MAISFTLDLTPSQIEFLQQLDLYASGCIAHADDQHFITRIRKLEREGLVEHCSLPPGQLSPPSYFKTGPGPKAFRITAKGRTVLGLIQQDVEAFLARQKDYIRKKKAIKTA